MQGRLADHIRANPYQYGSALFVLGLVIGIVLGIQVGMFLGL
jgi:hypothetical protein